MPVRISDGILDTVLEYDGYGRIVSRTHTVGGKQVYRMLLAYDSTGLINRKEETVAGSAYSPGGLRGQA
ncbi:MAG: hypothetical protein ACOY31_07200 [Bacillota bacterium]